MSTLTFRLKSIELTEQTINKLPKGNIFRVNLTTRPAMKSHEYIIDDLNGLYDINHSWDLCDPKSSCDKLTFTIRSVAKKYNLSNLISMGAGGTTVHDHTIDRFVGRRGENTDNNIQYEYIKSSHSLLGVFTISIKDIPKGINNIIKADLISRSDGSVTGFANIEIYIWKEAGDGLITEGTGLIQNTVAFIDPGCQPTSFDNSSPNYLH